MSDSYCNTCKHAIWDYGIFDISGKRYYFLIGCKEYIDDPDTGGCYGYEEWK